MKESEYVTVTDLARLRVAADVLRACYDKQARKALPIILEAITRLESSKAVQGIREG